MPRWKALPDELDPEIKEFCEALRRLVDRGGLSIAAVADRTGYSKTSWERYLNGRLLAPKGAIVALAEVTGTNPLHLTTMWELAERSWSRSEMRHDMTMEAIRISQARAALGESGAGAAGGGARAGSGAGTGFGTGAAAPQAHRGPGGDPRSGGGPGEGVTFQSVRYGGGPGAPYGNGSVAPPRPPGPAGPQDARPGTGPSPDRQRQKRRITMFLAGAVGAAAVIGAAVFLTGGGEDDKAGADPTPSPTPKPSKTALPAGVECSGKDCTGQDPESMGCGGEFAQTAGSVRVGTSLVEVRYSKTCGAAWARITQAAAGDAIRITAPGGAAQSSAVGAAPDTDAYTPMVAVKTAADAQACATLQSAEEGCTE
ncbi:XRE family transcriptional regulator [Streptomyces sp. NPDC091292]|uniref:XRE family transcriptional regulator n=1 Tax=Streptomyces sp. NPDC091292 TaxID=3365991 RepID=UPI00382E1879